MDILKKLLKGLACAILISCSFLSISCYAADNPSKVVFYLNDGEVPGIADGEVKSGEAGSSLTLPSPQEKLGYTFKGWLQQGNSGCSPRGTPVWEDGELATRPANDLYITAKVPSSIVATKVEKPKECMTKVSSTVTRVTWTENARYGGNDNNLGLIWNNFTIPANSYVRCMIYAKIPVGYVLVPSIGRTSTPGTKVISAAPEYTVSPSEFVGTGEYQYYDWVMFNGNGIQDVGLFSLIQTDLSLPQPSVSNPVSIDIGYYNYTKCDGSAGYEEGNSTGTYTFKNTGTAYLTAIYAPNIYYIKYDANGGTNIPNTQSYGYNTIKEIPITRSVPLKAGFNFLGWSTDKNATIVEYQSGDLWSCGLMSNTTLYANWKFSACSILSSKTIILREDGKGSFFVKGSLTSGQIEVLVPNTIMLKQINKADIVGTVSLSGTYLNPMVPNLIGMVEVPNLSAGSWNSTFNIYYKYTP